jgi:hypothetical protein
VEAVFIAGDVSHIEDGILNGPMPAQMKLQLGCRQFREIAACNPQVGRD